MREDASSKGRVKVMVPILAFLVATLAAAGASAEVDQVRIGGAPGLAFLPLYVMEAEKLVEKHLAAQGLPPTPVTWPSFTGGNNMNDALLSDNLDFANGGVPPFLTLWSRALGTRNEVKAIAAVSDIPSTLVTANPNVRTIRDFTERDRISVAAVKNSQVAILLQMAAEKEFGPGNHARLDPMTVTLPQPESVVMMLSGRTEITAHFTVPPFVQRELKDPKLRPVLRSTDVLGGVNTVVVAYATSRFRERNPKTFAAYLRALEEACALIEKDRRRAAELYLATSNDKMPLDELVEIMSDPALRFTPKPSGTMVFASFMHRIGSIPKGPTSWKDMFFREAHHLPGS
jgi:NitT/TauT family transport system substrate-binding protein